MLQPWTPWALYRSQSLVEVTVLRYAIVGSPSSRASDAIDARTRSGALADLECCVMLVSIRMHGYWCVLVAYGAGTARGPVGYRFGALRGVLLHSNAKT